MLRIRLVSKRPGLEPRRAVETLQGETDSVALGEVAETISQLLPEIQGVEFWSSMSGIFYLGRNDRSTDHVSRRAEIKLVQEIFAAGLESKGSPREGGPHIVRTRGRPQKTELEAQIKLKANQHEELTKKEGKHRFTHLDKTTR